MAVSPAVGRTVHWPRRFSCVHGHLGFEALNNRKVGARKSATKEECEKSDYRPVPGYCTLLRPPPKKEKGAFLEAPNAILVKWVKILYTLLLSAIPWHKYRSAPFDDLLLAVIFVYLPLLRDGSSLRK